MEKVLGIVVNNYPYGNGESFLGDELDELSKRFDKILLFIPGSRDAKQPAIYELPGNVYPVHIDNTNSFFHRFSAIFFIGPFRLLKMCRKEFEPSGFSFLKFRILMSYLSRERNFRKKLWNEIRKRSLDEKQLTLYSYWFTEYTYSLFRLKKKHPNITVYSRTHGWDIYYERHAPSYLPLRKPIIEGIDCTFTVSDHGRNYLMNKLDIPKGKIETFRLGVKKFKKNELKREGIAINILSLSFIVPIKRLELLIESLGIIEDQIQINWFHIGSGGEYENKIKKMAASLLDGRSNIRYTFKGNFSASEVQHFLESQSIDLFFNVSYDEGIPVSMMEALSAGIPIVGPNVGGIPEIIDHGNNGFLLSQRPDAAEIIGTIKHYLSLTSVEIELLRQQAVDTWEQKFDAKKNHAAFTEKLMGNVQDTFLICSRCILDSSDYPDIRVNDLGVCNVCQQYDKDAKWMVKEGELGRMEISKIVNEIKSKGKGKSYDCLIGISGGVDSTYLVYLAKTWGLNPLILHVDTGWNSMEAVQNIKYSTNKLGFDLHTQVIDWNELKDLQLSFLKASVVDIDLPVDNIIVACSYGMARKLGIRYILTGDNIRTESWLPPNFNHNKNDLLNIRDIHSKFGKLNGRILPLIGFSDIFRSTKVFGIKWFAPLNNIEYNSQEAKKILIDELAWKDYGFKHSENIFTRFYQGYILPTKFNVNKHKAHLSSMICSGLLTREQALAECKNIIYTEENIQQDKGYFLKKMNLSEEDFEQIMKAEPLPHTYYKSFLTTIKRLRPFTKGLRKIGLLK